METETKAKTIMIWNKAMYEIDRAKSLGYRMKDVVPRVHRRTYTWIDLAILAAEED